MSIYGSVLKCSLYTLVIVKLLLQEIYKDFKGNQLKIAVSKILPAEVAVVRYVSETREAFEDNRFLDVHRAFHLVDYNSGP